MRLLAECKKAISLLDLMSELGTCFYKELDQEEYEVVYFSSNRLIHFQGKLTEEQLKKIRQAGQKVSEIWMDPTLGELRIEE